MLFHYTTAPLPGRCSWGDMLKRQKVEIDSNITNSHEVYGEWEMFVHPSGAVYYYNETRNTYTGLNIRDCPTVRLEKFEAWVKAMRGKDMLEKIINRLASLGSDGTITEPGVALFGDFNTHLIDNRQTIPYVTQPEARLLRSHSMGCCPRKIDYFPFIATIAMFCLPILVCERLNQIYVDGTVNALDIKTFVDDFSSQNTAQITLAGVIMAVDAGFLAVQGVGTGTITESILKGSIIFCVGCITWIKE
ncbi:uncharacterized protein F5147DRAFT_657758 [Suillus discolor]|uniref:Uncharacterized protein n=1 Tax=Suillus discolor TaxID=1912936 RepID=A0A9P7EVX1_9AGAM|nr:uncharacterized protein F5147DRAFT_657758 [Suillus discolor]KAG2092140.1 hypothetical protein F5147DRAFT_657758 [Suillus discolor]